LNQEHLSFQAKIWLKTTFRLFLFADTLNIREAFAQ